jgi:long-chain acyl-CoA synthetase
MTADGLAPARPWLQNYPKEIDWHATFPEHSLLKFLEETVRRFPERPFSDFLGKKMTYRELGDAVNRAAKGFAELGVKKGVHVGLFLPNTPYYVVCYYAVLKAGGTVVNFNPLYAEQEVRHQIEDSRTTIMVTLDLQALYPSVAKMLGKTCLEKIVVCRMADILPFPKNILFPLVKRKEIALLPQDERHFLFARLVNNDGKFEGPAIEPKKDIAVLQYTGGTTGVPKGAMLTHFNLVANATQCHQWFWMVEDGKERALAVIPFFHVFAMTTIMNFSVKTGAEIVMLPRFELDLLLQTIERTKPTFFPSVPTLFTAIKNKSDVAKYDLRSIRRCISGGAPLPLEVKNEFEGLTGCQIVEGYGLTETSPTAACNPLAGGGKNGSIGIPMPGTTLEIVSLDDPTKTLPLGERGEIVISGPQVMAGYWNKPEETASILMPGGRFRTGDVGTMDADGYTFIVDRIKDMILCGGFNVYPRNIEEAIYQHPAVLECVVIGIPDDYRGQTPKAFIVRRQGQSLDEETLKAFLKDKLSPIECPKVVEFRDALPKTAVGKISRKELVAEENAKTKPATAA